jgi:hypothetical protein
MRDQPGSSSKPRGSCTDRLSDHPLLANFSAAVSAYRRAELADATATDRVEITDSAIVGDRVPAPGGGVAGGGVIGAQPQGLLQPPASRGPAGRGPAVYLAQPVDQGGVRGVRQHPPRGGETGLELAAPGCTVPNRQAGRRDEDQWLTPGHRATLGPSAEITDTGVGGGPRPGHTESDRGPPDPHDGRLRQPCE